MAALHVAIPAAATTDVLECLASIAVSVVRAVAKTTTMIAIPQGAGLIFASGLTAGDAMFSYVPMELQGKEADERLRARWDAHPPDVIVWWRENLMRVFGVKGFGEDYAQSSGKWVEEHYTPITDHNAEFVVLVRRKP